MTCSSTDGRSRVVFLHRVRTMWVPQCETAFLRVGTEGEAPKDDRDRQDAVPQTRLKAIQEWFQVRVILFWS
jgi:hypothetical protein